MTQAEESSADATLTAVYDNGHPVMNAASSLVTITMELVEGETLSGRLQGKMTIAEALPLEQHMASGLAAATRKVSFTGISNRETSCSPALAAEQLVPR